MCQVMMATFKHFFLFLSLGIVSVFADMKLDCQSDFVSLVWTETRPQVDTSLFRLGNCFPNSLTPTQAVFTVELDDCKFRQLVTGDQMVYSNNLTYISSPESHMRPFSHLIICAYQRPKDWYPVIYNPVFDTRSQGELTFQIGLMNDDFSGPAQSSSFHLGSLIPIMASVQQASHQPLQLFIEECVAATTPQLQSKSSTYTIINNNGCLVESKVSHSRFEPRQKPSEISLLLQAFRFPSGEQVFLHCMLVAWDPVGFEKTKKACNYIQGHGWKLLDNPSYSNLCDCCESSCTTRKARSATLGHPQMQHDVVLGPLTITDTAS